MFLDRRDAGRALAGQMRGTVAKDAIVLALPRGGAPVADEIAKSLCVALDVLLVGKIGTPGFVERALGAVTDGDPPVILRNEAMIRAAGLDESAFAKLAEAQIAEIARRRRLYAVDRPACDVAGRTVIVVDDGAVTGATLRAALLDLRRRGAGRLVVALPVAAAPALDRISEEADETFCLAIPQTLSSVGAHCADFSVISDECVAGILRKARAPGRPGSY